MHHQFSKHIHSERKWGAFLSSIFFLFIHIHDAQRAPTQRGETGLLKPEMVNKGHMGLRFKELHNQSIHYAVVRTKWVLAPIAKVAESQKRCSEYHNGR